MRAGLLVDVYPKNQTSVDIETLRGYIDDNGLVKSSDNYYHSQPIHLKAGKTIYIETGGSAFNPISLTDKDATFYIPLVHYGGNHQYATYKYFATEDCYVSLTWYGAIRRDAKAYTIEFSDVRKEIDTTASELRKSSGIILENFQAADRTVIFTNKDVIAGTRLYINFRIRSIDGSGSVAFYDAADNRLGYIGSSKEPLGSIVSGEYTITEKFSYAKAEWGGCGDLTIVNRTNNRILDNRVHYLETNPYIQERIISTVCRGTVTVNDRTVTLGTGDYYFFSNKGKYYSIILEEPVQYDLSGDKCISFNIKEKAIKSVNLIDEFTPDDNNLLAFDGVTKICDGLWYPFLRTQSWSGDLAFKPSITPTFPSFINDSGTKTLTRLTEWLNGDKAYLLAQVTDVHSGNSDKFKVIGYLNELNNIFGFNVLVNAGDTGLDIGHDFDEGWAFDLLSKTKTQMKSSSNWIFCIGNHERNFQRKYLGTMFNSASQRNGHKMIFGDEYGNYGYQDDELRKTRLIFLNTSDTDYKADTSNAHFEMKPTQINWLIDALKSVQEGWNIIIVEHICPNKIGDWVTYPDSYKAKYIPQSVKIMQDYINRRKGNYSDDSVNFKWDFTQAKGKLVCVLSGDSHFNNFVKEDGLNFIVRQGYGGCSQDELPPYGTPTYDSFNWTVECLFDVLAVKENGQAKVFRIGVKDAERDLDITY